MCCIQKKLRDPVFRKPCFHGKKGMQDRKMFLFRVPDMPEEIVKGTDAWHIIRVESTDDRI